MTFYLLYSAALLLAAVTGFRHIRKTIALTMPLWLYFLDPGNPDFAGYERSFRSVGFEISSSGLTSGGNEIDVEPLWLIYQALWKALGAHDYRVFLIVNFWICTLMIVAALRVLLEALELDLALALMVPISMPVMFLMSPRSSISFAATLLGLVALAQGERWRAAVLVLLGVGMHSQYLAAALFTIAALLLRGRRYSRPRVTVASMLAAIALFALLAAAEHLLTIIPFVPNEAFLASGLEYFKAQGSGFRVTGVVSILLGCWAVCRPRIFTSSSFEQRRGDLFQIWAIFGGIIGVVFIASPHIAGRLSRLSDYAVVPAVGARSLLQLSDASMRIAAGAAVIVAVPFLYPTVYRY